MDGSGFDRVFDIAIIGGGVNGAGIARDAAGRGLSVCLVEQNDLGWATSSASTKLFHGGLRYLEHYEFRLVRESLIERERLLVAMPHISWPLRFVLPHHSGLRPRWLLRLGLFLYDHLGGREILPGTETLDLATDRAGAPLKDIYRHGFEYSDCWVEDSRLVVLNARDAEARSADIRTRTRCVSAERRDGRLWRLALEDTETGEPSEIRARALVNAAGPWVDEVISRRVRLNTPDHVRLVRGSHIVTRKLYDHDRAYIFQNSDGRIVFAIPYEDDFTLIGTTDRDHDASPSEARITPEEQAYLLSAVSEYFARPVTDEDVVWTFSGVRPLHDDGTGNASAVTRDYTLTLEGAEGEAPLLNVFGGKITTYRKLAEAAMAKLGAAFPAMRGDWTARVPLPGGDFAWDGAPDLVSQLRAAYPFLTVAMARRLVRHYGTEAARVLGDAESMGDLGDHFGAGLTEAELRWLVANEFARTGEDVLWRRTKQGLRLSAHEAARVDDWVRAEVARRSETV